MKEFLKKNKFVILFFSIFIISVYAFYSRVFAYTYENLDFKYGKVKTECLNVRCGPGINYNKVGKVYKDEYINVFAKVGDWYIIQTNSELIGAVSSEYIEAIYNENEISMEKKKSNEQGTNVEVNASESINQENNIEFEDVLNLSEEEQEFLNLINSNRKNIGLSELQVDPEIQNIARLKVKDLNENNYFSHVSPTYGNIENMFKTFNINCVSSGENIAGNKNLAGAVEAWMNSENHKANILNEKYNYTGVAIIQSKTYGKIFVQVFAEK
ncbi:MAG: SH3 domain-containing protein [Clostridia bacterium]|nr:SH3 domain-containing protein [Clostridia bacterium]